ncbi:ATP-binding protein [Streptomyces sp. NPDC000410]|uniref:ATP-binding protein n=1 Tax=Streptomyces sp. NPDC000410 TaxID=3154254 RepID=UPI00332859C9
MNAETATPTVQFTQRLSATRRGARLARHLAAHQLDVWGFPYGGDFSDAAALLVSELATNAITHARVPGRDFQLRLALTATTLRIEVSDARADRTPTSGPTTPAPDSETGRGLILVEALATRWGTADRLVGKTVWAELVLP